MFPTLSLDLEVEGRVVHAVEIASLLEAFDSDSDGFLSEEDFFELMKFCSAWRSQFYLKGPELGQHDQRRRGSGCDDGSRSGRMTVNGNALRDQTQLRRSKSSSALTTSKSGGVSALGTSKSGGADRSKVGPQNPRHRRGSGFGPRLVGMDPSAMPTPLPALAKGMDAASSEKVPSRPSSAFSDVSEKALPVLKRTKSDSHIKKLGGVARRKSAPTPILDASLGSFYSTFAGVRRTASRDSSPSLGSDD
jgi:hypothetical protein